jgi:hypothetical protein
VVGADAHRERQSGQAVRATGQVRGDVDGPDGTVEPVGDEPQVGQDVSDTGEGLVRVHHLSQRPQRILAHGRFTEGREDTVVGEEFGDGLGDSGVDAVVEFDGEAFELKVVGVGDEFAGCHAHAAESC